MVNVPFDAPYSGGEYTQEREYYLRKILREFPDRSSDPLLVYGDPKLEFLRLANDGRISTDLTPAEIAEEISGTSSPIRTEMQKLFIGKGEQSLNVLDFGVKLDGTDQTENINRVLAMRKPVTFPQGTYNIRGTLKFDQNGVITTLGRVIFQIMEGCTKENFTPIVRRNGDVTPLHVVLDHARLGRGEVGAFQLRTAPGTPYVPGTVALGVSEEFLAEDGGQEPMNLFYSPKLAGCEWAIYGTASPVATAGGLTGNSYINLQSSCYNGIYIGQNQDDIVFSGSTRIRSVRGIAIKKDGGRNTHFDGVFIGFKQGATGVLIEKMGNTISFGFLFIETEDNLLPSYPVILDGGTGGLQQCTLIVAGAFTTNTPNGASNIIVRGNRDKFFIGSFSGLDWNKPKPDSSVVRLDHVLGQRTYNYGRIYYEGSHDDRIITVNPDVTSSSRRTAENSIFEVVTKSESGRYHYGQYYSDNAAFDTKSLEPYLINGATRYSDTSIPVFSMDRDRIIRMRGRIVKTATANEIAAAIPEEYRPKTNREFAVNGGIVTIRADGVITTTVAKDSVACIDSVAYKAQI